MDKNGVQPSHYTFTTPIPVWNLVNFRHSTTRNHVKRPYLDTVGVGSGVMNKP